MKKRNSQHMLWMLFVVLILTVGCTRNVKVSNDMQFKNPFTEKIQKKVLVVMSKEQAEAIVLEKPGALADTFRFEAGKSISSNLVAAMKAMFQSADFAYELPLNRDSFDYYILANYKSYKIEWGSTAFSTINMNVYIDYNLIDARKKKVLAVSTDGSSSWQRSGGEVAALINPFVNIFVTDSALGQAWDQAVANSISQWAFELQKYFIKK